MNINKISKWIYVAGRLSRDANAIQKGTIHKRIVNKVIGRKIVSKMWWK